MRRLITIMAAASLALSGQVIAAAPGNACAGAQCAIECVERIVAGARNCPD